MKNENNTIKCPLCKKSIHREKSVYHFKNKCDHSKGVSFYQFYNNITNGTVDKVIGLYKQGYSLNELCQSKDRMFKNVSRRAIECVLRELKIKVRSVKQSVSQNRCRDKCKNTCQIKYGSDITNVSQAKQVKDKKCETFLKHYGVDNIWKCDWWNEYQTKIMLEKYNSKRISGFSNKTQEEKDIINQKRIETKANRGYFDSQLEERVEKIMKEHNIEYKRPFFLFHHPYDFIFGGGNKKLLLELNGDYWHANPKIYKKNDIFVGGKTAQQIWERDKKFKECLNGTEWKLFILWESEIKQMSDIQIFNYLNKIINEN